MRSIRTIVAGIAGVFIAIIAVVVFILIGRDDRSSIASDTPAPDVIAERQAPATRANPMTPVTQEEAERRSELHNRLTSPEAQRSAAVMAPSVVTEVVSASGDDAISRELFGDVFPVTPEIERAEPEPEPEPEPETVAVREPEPEPAPRPRFNAGEFRDRFRTNIERPASNFGVRNFEIVPGYDGFDRRSMIDMEPSALRELLGIGDQSSIYAHLDREDHEWFEPFQVADGYGTGGGKYGNDGLSDPIVRPQYYFPGNSLGYGATGYSGPTMDQRSAARPAMTNVDTYGNPYTTSDAPNPYLAAQQGSVVLARSGDMISATLQYGFNSDDVRGLPIYALVHDYLPNGSAGPLNGARVQGQVAYSSHNAAIIFNTLVMANGREFPISAIAVSADSGRPGVAQNVNRHILSRYGSLFLGGLIQGVGEVAQIRLQDDNDDNGSTIIIGGDGNISVDRNRRDEPSDGEILAGALAPVGRNIANATSRGFNRPPTISAQVGMPFALVFVRTIVSDPADARTAFNPRTGRTEVVGDVQADPGDPTRIGATADQPVAPQQGAFAIPETGDVYTPATGAPSPEVWQSMGGQQ